MWFLASISSISAHQKQVATFQHPRRTRLWFHWTLLLLLQFPFFSQAAHSRRRIIITREKETYDRVITDFSPDGRLSQVEYGMEASRRGSTVVVVPTPAGIGVVLHASSSGKIHRLDHHIWLITAGLSGDARFLASHLRQRCQQHRLDYGEPPTTQQVAAMAGQFQHYLTRAGGVRPLGCTTLVVGIDPVASEDDGRGDETNSGQQPVGIPRVFQADPGGVVEPCVSYGVAGKASETISKDVTSILSSETVSLSHIVSSVAQSMLSKVEDPKTVDVWTFQPQRGRRGGVQATCYPHLDKESLSKIRNHNDS